MLAKLIIEEFEKVYEANKMLYPGYEKYARSLTKDVLAPLYSRFYEQFEHWQKEGLPREQIFDRIDQA